MQLVPDYRLPCSLLAQPLKYSSTCADSDGAEQARPQPYKSEVVRFLYESKLIGTTETDPVVSLMGAELRYLFMTGANLQGADLQRTNLVEAELFRVQLQEANLQEAYLGSAYLGEAGLRGTQLQHAQLYNVDLQGADLTGANLEGAELFEANLAGVDVSKAIGLTQEQLEVALGDYKSQVPNYLERPEAWSVPIEEQRSRLTQLP